MNEVVQTFDRHEKGIINAITTGANNARAERLNGSIGLYNWTHLDNAR